MTNTDGAAQGEWHYHEERGFWKWAADGDYDMLTLERLEALDRKAQTADVLAKALEVAASIESMIPIEAVTHGQHKAFGKVRAALAQYHAATEEATRP